jgi:hypothetical protein
MMMCIALTQTARTARICGWQEQCSRAEHDEGEQAVGTALTLHSLAANWRTRLFAF